MVMILIQEVIVIPILRIDIKTASQAIKKEPLKSKNGLGSKMDNSKLKFTIKIFFALLIIVAPAGVAFLLGYGGVDKVVSLFSQIFVLNLVILFIYELVLGIRLLSFFLSKRVVPQNPNFVLIAGVFILLIVLPPISAKAFRRYGALARLKFINDKNLCDSLLRDATSLYAKTGDDVVFVDGEQLPESFRLLGAESARVQGGTNPLVDISTSGRPYNTGWLVTPSKSSGNMPPNAIKIKDHIYRY